MLGIWVIVGLPFGFVRMRSIIYLKNGDLGTTSAVFLLNFIIAGIIGGFIASYKLVIAIYHILKGIINGVVTLSGKAVVRES
ncbi:DUF6050 family protein [Gorillibacterium sp. sgz5001074]|uniref:DUF6050 family protein n=1 Tax=Gorillibacterium sp. sgz5001074 TaxID=3446695 RepID=UPI003F66D87C